MGTPATPERHPHDRESVDNHATDPSRIWFFRNLGDPTVVRDPLVLKSPDGTPYNGATADNEGLAVLPDGDYLVSSETEPSIRIFGRDGCRSRSCGTRTVRGHRYHRSGRGHR